MKAKNKISSKKKNTVETILVILAILIIPLLFAVNSRATNSSTPEIEETENILPTAINSVTESVETINMAQQPPACTFPLAQTATEESIPEEYVFSEPEVVLSAQKGNIYHIAEWLPDSHQVLMTEELNRNSEGLESIILFDTETGKSEIYAVRPITYQSPVWYSELSAVVYPVMKYFDIDTQNRTYKFSRELWISYGISKEAQILSDNLSQIPFRILSNKSGLVYLSDNNLYKLDNSFTEIIFSSFDSVNSDYAKERRSDKPLSFNIAWQPNTSLFFLYSEGATGGGGYTFILNADTGNICELSLGGWASIARWSSDGRYLAFVKIQEYAFLYPKSDLTLLDTQTGDLLTLSVTPQDINGQHYVKDFIWAPDNHHLLAIGEIYNSTNTQNETGLYFVNFKSSESINVAPNNKSFVFSNDNNFAWSPDGSKVIIHCPTQTADQICIISVQRVENR